MPSTARSGSRSPPTTRDRATSTAGAPRARGSSSPKHGRTSCASSTSSTSTAKPGIHSSMLRPDVFDAALELAENANTYVPLAPGDERVTTDRYVLWMGGRGDEPGWNVAQ